MFLFLFSYHCMFRSSLIGRAVCSALSFLFLCVGARCERLMYFLLLLPAINPLCTPFTVVGEVCTEQTVQTFQDVLYRFGVPEYGNRFFAVLHDFKIERGKVCGCCRLLLSCFPLRCFQTNVSFIPCGIGVSFDELFKVVNFFF